MQKLLIVGVGGVGSWLAYFLHELKTINQMPHCEIYVADGDTVDLKNIRYQKFDATNVLDNKAECIKDRYNFNGAISTNIDTEKELKPYNCIVSCVDSSTFRHKFFNYMANNTNQYWIDLRSEGRTFAIFCKHENNTLEYMLNTLPKEIIKTSSCQLSFEMNNNIIQTGNRIAASIGAQCVLNWSRGDINPQKIIQRI